MGAPLGDNATLVKLAQRDPGNLPTLVSTASVLGIVQADVAAELGPSRDTPVVCGAPDVFAAAIGAGAMADFAGRITTADITTRTPPARIFTPAASTS